MTPIQLLAFGSLAVGGAFASPDMVSWDATPSDSLTLAEALRRAEGSNPGYRQMVNDLALNRLDRLDAWLALLPTPRVTALSTGMSWNLQTLGIDPFGNPVDNPEAAMVQSSNSTQSLGASFVLDLRNLLNLRQQEAQARARKATVVTGLRSLRTEVALSFLDAQERQLQLALEEALLETTQRNLEVTRRLHALGRRDRMDLLSAELDVTEREGQIDAARSDLSAALLALRNIIADDGLTEFTLVPEPLRPLDLAGLDDEILVQEALAGSPRIAQVLAQEEHVAGAVMLQRARWLPTLSLSVSASRQELERGGGGAFLSPAPTGDWNRNVAVQLNFPDLGQYFKSRNDTDRSRIQLRNHAESSRQVRLELEREVRGLLRELRRTERTLALQERRAALAQERRQLQLQAYALGRGSFIELQTASDQEAAALRAVLQSCYAFERARINLERALGRPLEG